MGHAAAVVVGITSPPASCHAARRTDRDRPADGPLQPPGSSAADYSKSGPGPASDLGDSESGIRLQIRPDGGLEPGGLKAGGHSPSSPSQESRRVISEGQTADRPRRTPAAAVASRRGERRATTTTRAAYRLRGSRLRAPVSIDILRVAAVVRWRITAGRGVGPCSTGRVR